MRYRLLVDVATDRIIWYTTDMSATIQNDDHSAIAEYEGDEPEGMNPGNSWNYGFKNQKIVLLNKPRETIPLVESNRASIRKFLIEKINDKRSKLKFDLRYADYVELLMYNDAYNYNGVNIEQLPWLQLSVKHSKLPPEKEVERIKFLFSEKHQALLMTEDLYLEMINRINTATNNDQLFEIRNEIFKRIDEIKT